MHNITNQVREKLFKYQDNKYGDFIAHLCPNLKREYFIGVRVPNIRKIAKELPEETINIFLNQLPHKYYEENLLHGFLIQRIKDYKICIQEINKFLPFVNNWANSDTMCPKIFIKHKKELLIEVKKWLKSKHTYTIRFGVLVLMNFYLDNDFKNEYLMMVSKIKSKEYYVNMMIAWFFATALAKQYSSTIKILENKVLSPWIHNKTIQKAIESYRISSHQKKHLVSLKITNK